MGDCKAPKNPKDHMAAPLPCSLRGLEKTKGDRTPRLCQAQAAEATLPDAPGGSFPPPFSTGHPAPGTPCTQASGHGPQALMSSNPTAPQGGRVGLPGQDMPILGPGGAVGFSRTPAKGLTSLEWECLATALCLPPTAASAASSLLTPCPPCLHTGAKLEDSRTPQEGEGTILGDGGAGGWKRNKSQNLCNAGRHPPGAHAHMCRHVEAPLKRAGPGQPWMRRDPSE